MYGGVDEAIAFCVGFSAREVAKEVKRTIEKRTTYRTRPWVKPWIARRDHKGAVTTVLREWAEEDPEDFRNHLRMTEPQFEVLLSNND